MHLFCVYTRVCLCKCMHTYMSVCVCACSCSWGPEEGVEYPSIVLLFHQGGVTLNLQVEFSQAGRKSASPSGPPVFTLFGARVLGVRETPESLHGFWDPNSDPHGCTSVLPGLAISPAPENSFDGLESTQKDFSIILNFLRFFF